MAVLLKPPQRNADGTVSPYDHPDISPDDGVIRRVSEYHIVDDGRGGRRISSMCFKPSSGANAGMSVDLEASILAAGLKPKEFVTTPRFMGSVRFTAGALRGLGCRVGFVPLPGNDHHGEVWGTAKIAKKVQSLAVWYVQIENVDLV